MKILIPTMLTPPVLAEQIKEMGPFIPDDAEVIASGLEASASVNRNYVLKSVQHGEIAVMIDDDIRGFYQGWIDDLTKPLRDDASVVMVSARLLTKDLRFGPTCSRVFAAQPDEIPVQFHWPCVLPTAAIAFRHRGHMFDENFRGSGWEDNDWCLQYIVANQSSRFIQSNRCKLVHLNEMKGQHGPNWDHNKAYFFSKWSHIMRTR